MKSCPTCNRTFEDTFTFCLIDGAVLSAPFDPQATLATNEPGQTEPPPTEVLPNQEEVTEETVLAQPASPYRDAPLPIAAPPVKKSNSLPLILGGIVTLLVIGVLVSIVAIWAGRRTGNSSGANANKNRATVADAAPKQSPSPASVINLEGTVWRTKDGGIFKFMKGGKYVVPDPDIPCTWTQDQEKVFMRCNRTKKFVGAKDYGTIKGDNRIEGYSVHDNGDRNNWVFFRQN